MQSRRSKTCHGLRRHCVWLCRLLPDQFCSSRMAWPPSTSIHELTTTRKKQQEEEKRQQAEQKKRERLMKAGLTAHLSTRKDHSAISVAGQAAWERKKRIEVSLFSQQRSDPLPSLVGLSRLSVCRSVSVQCSIWLRQSGLKALPPHT